MSVTQRSALRESRNMGLSSTDASAPKGAAGRATPRLENKLASNPFVQQSLQEREAARQAGTARTTAARAGRENMPARKDESSASGFAAARRKFAAPASQESSVMSRSKTARKVSEAAGVLGSGRIRLSRQSLASFPSIDGGAGAGGALLADAPGPSGPPSKWMEKERDSVQAYEYLCHCSEAQQWMERVIGEPLGGDIANMAEEMRNGIALAKLAKTFEPSCVPRIFVHPRLQFRHTDNINYYFQFVDKIRLPNCFRFELTDLYEKKNFPKVVYCLHALSHFMAHHGRSDKVDDLVGKLEFNEEQLHKTQKTIDASGLSMPSFGGVGQALAQEMGAGGARRVLSNDTPKPLVPPPSTLQAQRAHLKHVTRDTNKPAEPTQAASLRANLKPVGSEPMLRSPDRRAHDALERELTKQRANEERIAQLGQERLAKMEARERERREREQAREQERLAQQHERRRQREEREERVRALEQERLRKRAEFEREREKERERLREEDAATLAKDRERRDLLYSSVRSSTQRELAAQRTHLEQLQREREEFEAERERERQSANERLLAAEERARAEEREREEKERFRRELEYEMERQHQMEAYAAELAAAHAETAAAEARLRVLTEEAARRDAAERERTASRLATPLQAAVRGVLARRAAEAERARCATLASRRQLVQMQAQVRGVLLRQALFAQLNRIDETWVLQLQSQLYERLLAMDAQVSVIVQVQASVRGVLARRALLQRMEAVEQSAWLVQLQALARGLQARRAYAQMRMAFRRAEVVTSVNGMQTSLRAALSRRKHQEMRKQMEYVKPDVTGLQAQIRGVLARQEYDWWWHHLHSSVDVVVYLQSMLRGVLARRVFDSGLGRYVAQIEDVVLVQSLARSRRASKQYQALRRGVDVPLETVQAFSHLLDDSGRDYDEELAVTRLRTGVVQRLRENEAVEAHVADLDRKIALLVKNKIGIEDVLKAKTERGLLSAGRVGAWTHVLTQADDPFAEAVLSPAAQQRLEQYQSLFFVLQTQPTYLARLLVLTNAAMVTEEERRQLEQTVLAMYAYAQQPREEYLLLKLVRSALMEQMPRVTALDTYVEEQAPFLRLLHHFTCGVRERDYLCLLLGPAVHRLASEPTLELEADPIAIQRAHAGATGAPAPSSLDGMAALEEPTTRATFLQRLQSLRATCETFLQALRGTNPVMPYGLQYTLQQHDQALQTRFPTSTPAERLRTVTYLLYRSYLHPAIVAPESFGMTAVSDTARRNLAQVSEVLAQVARGAPFGEDRLYLQPLNDYVLDASPRLHRWVQTQLDACDAPDLHFGLDEYMDVSGTQRPVIYISPNEVYAVHQLLCNNEASLCAPGDALSTLLQALGTPPVSATAELSRARDSEVTLELSPRFVRDRLGTGGDADMETRELFVETKRLVLALLRVQTAPNLVELLVSPITEADEHAWALRRTQPPYAGTPTASLSLADVKAQALEHALHLEQLGRLHRANQYQDVLDAIAADIRGKHRRRLERRSQHEMLAGTLQKLGEQRQFMEAQIHSYEVCMDRGMQAMQTKSRRRLKVMPFSPQFFHQRSLKAAGALPAYGSFKYTASRLRSKGVLAHIERPENLAMDQLAFTISSNEIGCFQIETTVSGISAGMMTVKMDELLEAQYKKQPYLSALDGALQFHLDPLLRLINKKFYV
ncbi:iqgap- protein [Malassezia equina]|uniref:Iqgap- protein n=1 Tax=Malassezia equina TaxID=1381935 RepID=A0AAF0EKK3_9BASI|nr:iqgap- protein [Malassezia equina]